MATATYVYCVVQGARRPSAARMPAGLPGGETPRLDEVESRMWVVHAPVPLARYGTWALQESLRELEWVSKIAVAHEAVVEHFAAPPRRHGDSDEAVHALLQPGPRDSGDAAAERASRIPVREAAGLRRVGCPHHARPAAAGREGRRQTRNGSRVPGRAQTGSRPVARSACATRAQAADDAYALLAGIAADHRRRQQEASGRDSAAARRRVSGAGAAARAFSRASPSALRRTSCSVVDG